MDQAGSLATRLRWARREQAMTLQQLSERTHRAVSYLCQLETGAKLNPTKQTVEVLAEVLGVRPAFLFGEVPSPVFDPQVPAQSGSAARALCEQFRQYFDALPQAQRLEIGYGMPAQRFALVVRFLLKQVPQNFTPIELAWQLGMSLAEFRSIVDEGKEVSLPYMEQMTRIVAVPLTFFTHGTLDPIQFESAAERRAEVLSYLEAIKLAQQCKVSPERLAALIRAAAQ